MNSIYNEICNILIYNPDFIVGPRGLETRELVNARIILKDPTLSVINLVSRNIDMKYLAGELAFYLSGSNNLSFIKHYSSFWEKISDDGLTVNSAYGKRLFMDQHNGQSQYSYALAQLINDKDTRKAVMFISGPDMSLIGSSDNVCTNELQFMIRDNKLHMFTTMRSNDIWFGLTYDVVFFTFIQRLVLVTLKHTYPTLELGEYIHDARSLHVYSRNYDAINIFGYSRMKGVTRSVPDPSLKDVTDWFSELLKFEVDYRAHARSNKPGPIDYIPHRRMTQFEYFCARHIAGE